MAEYVRLVKTSLNKDKLIEIGKELINANRKS